VADTKISGLTPATNMLPGDLFAVDQAGSSVSETAVQLVGGYACRLHATYTLTNTTAVQKLFNASTNGAVTLPIGAYLFDCLFSLSSMSATSGNASFSLAVGTAVIANELMYAVGIDGLTATAAAQTGSTAVTAAFPASMVTAGTAAGMQASVHGSFEVTTQGTVIPSIALVTGAAAVVAIGSHFRCYPIAAAAATTTIGNWS
jgi:hypothetical protein